MAEQIATTYQEALDALSKVADGNGDCFRIKVVRRPNASSSVSQHIATFGNASWRHIADAESWLQPFCGGGLYILQIFDGKDARRQYGTITPSEIMGAPRPPNARITQSAAWTGPELLNPESVNGGLGTGATALSSTSFNLAGEPYGGVPPRMGVDAGLASLFDASQRKDEEVRRREQELAEKERRAELAAVKREADERAARLETRINDLLVTAKAAPPPPPAPFDFGGLLTGIAAAAAPVVAAIVSVAQESRRAQLEIEKARLEREEKEREREAAAREREAADRKAAAEAAAKRPLIDPQFLDIMDRQAKRAEDQVSQFSSYLKMQAESSRANMEASAVAQRSMMQLIADVAQIQLKATGGEEKEGIDWGKVVQGALSGLAMLKGGGPGMGGPPGAPGAPQLAGAPAQPPAPLPEVPESEVLNKVEDRIRNKDPVDQIVADLKAAMEDPSAQAEIKAEGGVVAVFEARLSDFAEEKGNAAYLDRLAEELQKAGLFPGGGES